MQSSLIVCELLALDKLEAILGYLVLPHKQRLKAVQVNDCYFAEGSHSSSGISLFHKGVSVKAVG